MDGTLIDTEPSWIGAEIALAERFGVTWTHEDGLSLVGNPLEASADVLIARGIALTRREVIDALVGRVAADTAARMPWMDDAKSLLDEAVAAGVRCALVTASIGALVEGFLEAAGHVFEVVVMGDQVSRGKPDPEPYLTAAARLGVDVRECVAIEDSAAGVRAAHASGAATVAVRRHVEIPDLDGLTVVDSLAGISLADLTALVTERRD